MQTSLSLTIPWLVRLRWVAIASQSLLIMGVALLTEMDVPMVPLHLVLVVAALTNIAFGWWSNNHDSESIVPWVLGLDIMFLTAGLQLSGGPMNPFSFLYVVHVALAAFVVRGIATWVLLGMAIGGYGLLYAVAAQDPHLHHHSAELMQLHLDGMWVAMAAAAAFIVFFTTRLRNRLDQQADELQLMRERQSRQDKLSTLATLAAGAAHELATPLASIAIASKEMELILKSRNDELVEEVGVIRSQSQRCQDILKRLSAQSGRIPGEGTLTTTVSELCRDAVQNLSQPDLVHLDLSSAKPLRLPAEVVTESLAALMQNSIDAGASRIDVRAEYRDGTCAVRIQDDGKGMPEEVLMHAFEPFFTTKHDSENHMGLGLFVAHQLAQELGGSLHLSSNSEGTTLIWTLPCQDDAENVENHRD